MTDKNTKPADDADTAEETAEESETEETTEEETAEEPTPIASKSKAKGKATVERVGSAGSSGASLVYECSLGDFHARGGSDGSGNQRDPIAEVKAHIAAEHGK